MSRRRTAVALLLGLALLAVAAAGCGGGTATVAAPTTLRQLASSAERSAGASSGRFSFALEMSAPGFVDGLAFTGEGAFDTVAGKSQMSLDLSSFLELMKGLAGSLGGSGSTGDLDPDDFRLEAVMDELVMYMRFPFLRDKIPGGKEWVKIDLRQAASRVPGLDLDQFLQFANNGPQTTLEYLKAVSGPIETVGVEDVRGTETTHYRTAVDLRKYAQLVPASQREQLRSMLDQLVQQAGLSEIPVDVWVGADALVRKLELTMSMAPAGSTQSATASMRIEMYDYGKPVTITLPLPEDTTDISRL